MEPNMTTKAEMPSMCSNHEGLRDKDEINSWQDEDNNYRRFEMTNGL